MHPPTAAERKDFRLFCQQASIAQLHNIYHKESTANRRAYATIAREVLRDKEHGII